MTGEDVPPLAAAGMDAAAEPILRGDPAGCERLGEDPLRPALTGIAAWAWPIPAWISESAEAAEQQQCWAMLSVDGAFLDRLGNEAACALLAESLRRLAAYFETRFPVLEAPDDPSGLLGKEPE